MASAVDLKIVTVGPAGVGKTCIIYRYVHNNFNANSTPTIGSAFALKSWGGYKLGIWDTAGAERFAKLTSHYCRGAGAAILVYDITDFQSFDMLDQSLKTLREGGALDDCFIVVVGTKLDLVEGKLKERKVPIESAQTYAEQIGAAFMETSAKTGANITELFDLIGQRVLKDRQPKSGAPGTSTEHADIRAKGSTASVNTGGSSPTVQLQASGTGSSNTKCPC